MGGVLVSFLFFFWHLFDGVLIIYDTLLYCVRIHLFMQDRLGGLHASSQISTLH